MTNSYERVFSDLDTVTTGPWKSLIQEPLCNYYTCNSFHKEVILKPPPQCMKVRYADYSMYSTFLTASPGSVLFRRSTLLKRKDLCFSCLRLGLIRHRRSLRSSHLPSQVVHDFFVDLLSPPAHTAVCALWRRLSLHLYFTVSQVPLIYH